MDYKSYFKNKKITLMGLGLLGRGVGDAKFLLECGAQLTITDPKDAKVLAPSINILKKYKKNIKYVLGKHDLADFQNADMVIKAPGVSLDSTYIAEARKHTIPVEMDASLFARLTQEKGIIIIGITGTRGKSTTTQLIFHILKNAYKGKMAKVYLGGNIRGTATLPLIKKVSRGDIVVLELDSWQLQGFGESKISPHISVFTNLMSDHMNYYKNDLDLYLNDKAQIFLHQKQNDYLVVGQKIAHVITAKYFSQLKSPIITAEKSIAENFKTKLLGEHNLENISCAVSVARIMNVNEEVITHAVKTFKPVEGRLQYIKTVKGVKIYNDNNSTTPDATIAALQALGNNKTHAKTDTKNIILIMGGDDKKLDMTKLVEEIPTWCSKVVLFKERGTDTISKKIFAYQKQGIEVYEEEGLKKTVARAFKIAKKGEVVLYSPAFSSFGTYFKNEYDRNDQFLKLIKSLGK